MDNHIENNGAIESPKAKKPNAWLEYVKEVRKQHSDKSYKEILQLAKESYKPIEKTSKPVKSPLGAAKKTKTENKEDEE